MGRGGVELAKKLVRRTKGRGTSGKARRRRKLSARNMTNRPPVKPDAGAPCFIGTRTIKCIIYGL